MTVAERLPEGLTSDDAAVYFPPMAISTHGNYARFDLSAMFAALADPTRLALVEILRDGDANVGELAAGFSIGLPAISKHLTVLEKAGLISRHRDAQWRNCRLEAQAFERMNEWMRHYTQLWEGSLDRLNSYVNRLAATEGTDE
ncbi:MAG TPA: metalloregulator ArsR/SmtB family transcription factor [Microbacteriaceae bacterium]